MQNKNSNIPPPVASTEALLQEFEALHDAIVAQGCDEGCISDGSPELLAIVRLVSGLTSKEWAAIAEKYNLGHWLALDLNMPSTHNLAVLYEDMRELAFQKDHDPLTGLPNRRMFMRNFQVELERQQRQHSDLSLASIDLDHFKRVNDTWGHGMGDVVLKRLGEKLMSSKRSYDTAARLGGEEFALLLPGAGQNRAKAIVQRVLNEFRTEKFNTQTGEEFSITFSAGIASVKNGGQHSLEYILDVADRALYDAKNKGRNKIVATHVSVEDETKKIMVHSDEKHFLFFGKHR